MDNKNNGKDQIFVFTFVHFKYTDDNKDEGMYSVYTKNELLMKLFLAQHNFDIQNSYVEVTTYDDFNENYCENNKYIGTDDELFIFKLKSNSSDKIFHIVSSDKIVSLIAYNTIDKMMLYLDFGKIYDNDLVKEIEFIEEIRSLVESIPHSIIINSTDEYDDAINDIYESFLITQQFVYAKQAVLEITMDAYASGFVELIMDLQI